MLLHDLRSTGISQTVGPLLYHIREYSFQQLIPLFSGLAQIVFKRSHRFRRRYLISFKSHNFKAICWFKKDTVSAHLKRDIYPILKRTNLAI